MLISVLTCKRPENASYVEATINYIDKQTPANVDRILICDGINLTPPSNWEIVIPPVRFDQRIDNKIPAWQAINRACKMQTDLLFLEDDIAPLFDDSFLQMINHPIPDWATFVSFFHPSREPGRYKVSGFIMSQAILVPFRTIKWWDTLPAVYTGDWEALTGVDNIIAMFGRMGQQEYELTENLIEHVGVISAHNYQPSVANT